MTQSDLQQIYSHIISQEKSLTFRQMIFSLAREIYGSSDSINKILTSNSEILGDDFNIIIQDPSQKIYNSSTSTNDHINQDVLNVYEGDVVMHNTQENNIGHKDLNYASNHNSNIELTSEYTIFRDNILEAQHLEQPPLLGPIIDLGPTYVNGEKPLENLRPEEPDEIIIQRRPLISESQNFVSPTDEENKGSSGSQAQPRQSSNLASDVQSQERNDSHYFKKEDENSLGTFLNQEYQREKTIDIVKNEVSASDNLDVLYKFPDASISSESNSIGTKEYPIIDWNTVELLIVINSYEDSHKALEINQNDAFTLQAVE
ncbi:14796_t:CDS:2 [Cetraspora pellucida]|uniref:14796_t:CDS:1 n=1 Tax=Cetraspora pellucida TaxID=1433469 RepID=A0A9N9ADW5_9GLOM|nr:14796_t:CDS:2 [Cetraspora pellucida]